MGRIKTTMIKRSVLKLVGESKDKFTSDFEHNKKAVSEMADIPSKKMRNIMAGYVSRLMKK